MRRAGFVGEPAAVTAKVDQNWYPPLLGQREVGVNLAIDPVVVFRTVEAVGKRVVPAFGDDRQTRVGNTCPMLRAREFNAGVTVLGYGAHQDFRSHIAPCETPPCN